MTGSGKAAMLTILFRVDAKPGKRKELIDFLEWDQKESVQKERGTLRFDFFQDPEMADRFYVYEAYEDRLAFEEHKKHKPYKRWCSRVFQERVVHVHRDLKPVLLRSRTKVRDARRT